VKMCLSRQNNAFLGFCVFKYGKMKKMVFWGGFGRLNAINFVFRYAEMIIIWLKEWYSKGKPLVN